MIEQPQNRSWATVFIGGCLAMMICLLCAGIVGVATGIYFGQEFLATLLTPTVAIFPSSTATPNLPTTALPSTTPSPSFQLPTTVLPSLLEIPEEIKQIEMPAQAHANLQALLHTQYPVHNYYEVAQRLSHNKIDNRTVIRPTPQVGDRRSFTTDTGQVRATLYLITDYLYLWVDNRLDLDLAQLAAAAQTFEQQYYPVLTDYFGEEWNPGIDNDPHFSILHLAEFADNSEIGYFDSADEYPQSVSESSNEQEIIYLNMSKLELGDELYFGTLSHETQHLIQWHQDGNETTWIDEGLAQLAETILQLDSVDTHYDWLDHPETQLNNWSYEEDEVYIHYGGAYLFMVYLWEQLGDEAVRDLARHPANGLEAVADILATYRPQIGLEQFVADWATANWLDNESDESLYQYDFLALGQPQEFTNFKRLPATVLEELAQFGVHYLELELSGTVTITFAGDTVTALMPAYLPSGTTVWFAPPVDNVSAQLTRSFDLTNLTEATLSFWTWYDLETDYDFAYLTISTDGGQTWEILPPRHATAGQFGAAYGGQSENRAGNKDGWLLESISLNSYVGQEVLIRFELLTDTSLSEGGFALDDIAIAELGYLSNAEDGEDGWKAVGFVQTGWQLPQRWSVRLIQDHAPYSVQELPLDSWNQGQWQVELGRNGATLLIMPQTPFARQPARYWLEVSD